MNLISISAKGMMTVKTREQDFFMIPIDASGGNKEIKSIILHINDVWKDIESLNIVVEMVRHRICNEEDYLPDKNQYLQIGINILIGMMQTLNHSMYINYFIVHKQLEKLNKIKSIGDGKFVKKYIEYTEAIGKKIRDIRNHIIVKRDKPDFYKKKIQIYSTEGFAMDFVLEVEDKDGKKRMIECNAIKDGRLLQTHLTELFAV